ncbi:MAG: hypothetical protein AAFU67_14500, partial [Bacteroidota bacterium]
LDLVTLMAKIDERDQRHRLDPPVDWTKQQPLDKQNFASIDSLYQIHQQYIGRSLVGEKFQHVMWTVIQHSDLDGMERYLPVIAEAVKKEDLPVAPFKMLIDRIHHQRHGYQIFGSQVGVELAPDGIREMVARKYNLN